MVPLPSAIAESLTLRLQALAATLAGVAFAILDFPFEQSGADIILPTTTIHVAEACNGLRFLTALVVMTIAFAYMSQRTLVRGAVLVASAIPIAMLANGARVTAIVAGVYYIGPQVATGSFHDSIVNEDSIAGALLGLTLISVAALGLLLRRGDPRRARNVVVAGSAELARDQAGRSP
jgi:exosortase